MNTAPTPAAAAAPSMVHTADPQPAPAPPAEAATPDDAASGAGRRTRLRDQIAANPLLSLFGAVLAGILGFMGTVVIALLVHSLATTNDRFSEINDRLAAQDTKIDAGFAAQDIKIDEIDLKLTALIADQDTKIDEIDLKLTALIAALGMTPHVDAALGGTLLDAVTADTATTAPR